MKRVLYYFFNLLFFIHKTEGQTYCSGISIAFDLTGNYCGIYGNINFYHDNSSILIYAGFSNVTTDKFNRDLCIKLNDVTSISTKNNQCSSFDPLSYIGNFTINLELCDEPYEIFKTFLILNNRDGLYSDNGTCNNEVDCNILGTTINPATTSTQLTLSTSTPAQGSYYPCYNWITVVADSSNELTSYQFQTQLTFIETILGQMTHPERIRYGEYNEIRGIFEYPWDPSNTQNGLQQAINTTNQTTSGGSILRAIRMLVSDENLNQTAPDSTLIFVANTANSINIQQAVNLYNSALKYIGIKLTFILVGSNTNAADLQGFDDAIIYNWQNIGFFSEPDGWDLSDAFRCIAAPYIPCQSWIYFGIDDSNALNSSDYVNKLSFISSAIGNLNHPERIAAVGMFSQSASWNSGLTIQQIQSGVLVMPQSGPYSLRQQFAALLINLQNITVTDVPVGALIFISNTSDSALAGADQLFNQLFTSIRITFVLIGNNVEANKLSKYSNNTIFWYNSYPAQPTYWNESYSTAYGCKEGISTFGPTSTVSPSRTSTYGSTPTVSYIPCPSWISFGVDDSNTLDASSFANQINFISSAIKNITHPERIAALSAFNNNVSWKSGLNITEIQNTVLNFQQSGAYSLRLQLQALARASLDIPSNNYYPIGALIFISDTSVAALNGSENYISILSNVNITTFVLLGPNADQNRLTNFSTNFINWKDLSQSQPDNWDNLYGSVYGCGGGVITPVTTPLPYYPCQNWICFSYDDSNTLQNEDFRTQMKFISNATFQINHPYRLRVNGAYSSVASWNNNQTSSQIRTEVNSTQQSISNSYSLSLQFAGLLADIEAVGSTNWLFVALIFISDTSDAALENANNFFSQLPQNVSITFILLGSNVDESKLTQFSSNFIYWHNLSQRHPENWDNLYYAAYGCINGFKKLNNNEKLGATTKRINDMASNVKPSLEIIQPKIKNILPASKLPIDEYCISTPTISTTTFFPSTPSPNEIIPPVPILNCSDSDNSYIIDQTCRIINTSDPTTIDQLINTTSTHIQEKINNDNFTAANVHDTGIFLYNTVTTVNNLTQDGAHKFLDITNSVVKQPLDTLAGANNITPNSLLWYPSSLPKVIAKTRQDLNYSNILVHSFTLNDSFCVNTENSHEVCYSSTSQVPSGSKDAEFCTSFNPYALCNNAQKAFLIMWKSLSFFALVKNNTMNIKNGLGYPQSPDQPTTFDTADRCSDGTYYKNNYGSNVGGVYPNGDSIGTGSYIWIKRRDDENDLHITKYKIAKFIRTSFEDSGSKVTKSSKHYTSHCPNGMCTLVVDGNPTEPIVCSSGAKTTASIITGFGIFLAVIGIAAVIIQSDAIPIVGRVFKVFFSIFGDKNLPVKLKFFACCYNITFMIYSFYSIFISQQTIEDTSQNWCTSYAIFGYILYISAVFLSVIMLIMTLDALGCWKPALKNMFYIFTGNKKNYIPFIHSYGIPIILTGIFAVTLTSFFKRNDGYCWVRPDYAILALWFPIILLLLTIPFYIILFSRRWSNLGISKLINSSFTIQEELNTYEEEKKKLEESEKQQLLKEFTEKLFGKKENGNESEEEKAEEKKLILTNSTLALLIIPQIFLAIPLIAENLALYYSQITGWHYLFLFTQALQLIVLNGIDWLESLPEKLEFVKAGLDVIKGKPKKEESEESKWGRNVNS